MDQGRAVLWPLHLARLTTSAQILGLPLPDRLPSHLDVVAAASGVAGVAAVRLTADSAGIRLAARPVPPAGDGWRVCAGPHGRVLHALLAHKTTARAEHEAAAAHACLRECQEALWVDPTGRLTEGTITNLFIYRRGRVLTPAATCGLLPGIARGRLLAAGRLAGQPVEEAEVYPADLAAADEAFVTNAVRGAIPILAWEGMPLRRGTLWQAAVRVIFAGGG